MSATQSDGYEITGKARKLETELDSEGRNQGMLVIAPGRVYILNIGAYLQPRLNCPAVKDLNSRFIIKICTDRVQLVLQHVTKIVVIGADAETVLGAPKEKRLAADSDNS